MPDCKVDEISSDADLRNNLKPCLLQPTCYADLEIALRRSASLYNGLCKPASARVIQIALEHPHTPTAPFIRTDHTGNHGSEHNDLVFRAGKENIQASMTAARVDRPESLVEISLFI